MQTLNLKPSHKPVAEYYRALEQFRSLKVSHETAVRSDFQNLLEACSPELWRTSSRTRRSPVNSVSAAKAGTTRTTRNDTKRNKRNS